MGKMVQIRNMPEAMHRRLKAKAAQEGLSLSAYLLRELRRVADRPTDDELRERIKRLPRIDLGAPAADIIREAREERAKHLDDVSRRR